MRATSDIIELVGGPRAWAAVDRTRRGRELRSLRYSAAEKLGAWLDEPVDRLLDVIYVAGRTAQRRAQAGVLSPEESDRLMRVAALVRRAIEIFGDERKARVWLKRENRALGGRRPLDLLGSELEAAEVEAVLTRIEFGELS